MDSGTVGDHYTDLARWVGSRFHKNTPARRRAAKVCDRRQTSKATPMRFGALISRGRLRVSHFSNSARFVYEARAQLHKAFGGVKASTNVNLPAKVAIMQDLSLGLQPPATSSVEARMRIQTFRSSLWFQMRQLARRSHSPSPALQTSCATEVTSESRGAGIWE
jgi:hypothetical protein